MRIATVVQIENLLDRLSPKRLGSVLDFVSYLLDCQEGETAATRLAEAGMTEYSVNLEDYEARLARGEIQW